MIKGVIFDMDGVLVDNRDAHIDAFEIFCNRYGVTDWRERIAEVFGMGNDDIMRRIMPADIVEQRGTAALADEKERIYREIYASTIEPVRGLREILRAFGEAGIACAVGSSGCAENVRFVLEKCGIEHCFAECVSGDMVTRCKPDPEIYLTAAAKLGLSAGEGVVFEDSKAGIKAARGAGMKVIALATTLTRDELAATGADMIIDDYTQIDVETVKSLA
ncbi:MAG: HAD family phosphatase [Alistipes sp.]|nr:HAD family phosphatase [Alistipes sp.]MDE6858517.1 HAD family phosphatase [Alistipes sp.]